MSPVENSYKGNKGEWGEVYVLLRLLADGVLYEGDEQMRRTANYVDVLGALRKEASQVLRFDRDRETDMVIVVGGDGVSKAGIPVQRFDVKAKVLLDAVSHIRSKGKNRIPELDDFLKDIGLSSVKSSPFTGSDGLMLNKKSDIILKTRSRSGLVESCGYSIKSFLGSAPTLFNCAPASAMVYEIVGANADTVDAINMICNDDGGCDLDGRINYILDHSLKLVPIGTAIVGDDEPFAANLELCGLDMLPFVQELLLYRFAYKGESNFGHLNQVISMMVNDNPMDVRSPAAYYPARIKQFAYDSFAGLVATERWDGFRRINGGYIDVKSNGDVLFYPARSDDQFMSYLMNNLKIEIPDKGIGTLRATLDAYTRRNETPPAKYVERYEAKLRQSNPTRADFGYAYVSDAYGSSKVCFKLNFTLRFK